MTHNEVTLIGNLGADPEVRKTDGGLDVVRCRVATSESFKKNDEWVSKTQWHNVTVFGIAGVYFGNNAKKGQQVLVAGRIEYREYNDKWYTDIIANKVRILEPKKTNSAEDSPARSQPSKPEPSFEDDLNDEVPF